MKRSSHSASWSNEAANVEFAKYEGAHSWQEDVFGNMRKGKDWLEADAPPEVKATK